MNCFYRNFPKLKLCRLPHADMFGAKQVGMDRILFNTNQHPVEVDVTHEINSLRELMDLLPA